MSHRSNRYSERSTAPGAPAGRAPPESRIVSPTRYTANVTPTTPSPSSADLRLALRRWRRSHRAWVVAGLVVAAVAWTVLALGVLTVGPSEQPEGRATIQTLLTAVASSAALTAVVSLYIGHLATAGLRWPGHFGRLPRLIRDVWRASDAPSRHVGVGLVAGVVVALFVQPQIAAGLAAVAIGMMVTDVGRALIEGWQAAADTWRRVSLAPARSGVADRRLAVVAGGFALALVGLTRFFAVDWGCSAEQWLGASCGGPDLAVASAAVVGSIAALPLFLALGALVSLTLDGHVLSEVGGGPSPEEALPTSPPEPTPEPRPEAAAQPSEGEASTVAQTAEEPVAPPPSDDELALAAAAALAQMIEEADRNPMPVVEPEPPTEDLRVDDQPLVEEPVTESGAFLEDELPAVDPPFEPTQTTLEITEEPIRDTTAPYLEDLAHHLEELSPGSEERLQPLLHALSETPPGRAREIIDQISQHHGTVATFRGQYRRAPGIAKGAIERACVSGLKVAGVGGDDANALASVLLTLPDDDWSTLTTVLGELEERLPGTR